MVNSKQNETAVFGGGCFWCLEAVYTMLKGVIRVESGYAGGFSDNPSYAEVCSGTTGHAEVTRIEFDPAVISYELLLDIFFAIHDPTTPNQQGNDVGTQYRSIILYTSEAQEKAARRKISDLTGLKTYPAPIVTEVWPLGKFFAAEDYHQQYFASNEHQPYCKYVISPKVEKFQDKFAAYIKSDHTQSDHTRSDHIK